MLRTPALLRASWVQTASAIPRSGFSKTLSGSPCPEGWASPGCSGLPWGYGRAVGNGGLRYKGRCTADEGRRLRPWMLVALTGTGIAEEWTALLVRLPVTGEARSERR